MWGKNPPRFSLGFHPHCHAGLRSGIAFNSPQPSLSLPLLTGFRRQPVTPGFFSGPRPDKMSGNGIDGGARNLACARLACHPYGLFACAQSPKFCPRALPTKEFSRPLFSGPRPDYDIKKENHLGRWFCFLEREKGLGPSTPTLARSCSTN